MSEIECITGPCHSGKSTRFLQRYLDAGGTDTGLFSRKRLDARGDISGYDLLLLPDKGRLYPLADLCTAPARFAEEDRLYHGRFVFSLATFALAAAYVRSRPSAHVWIDEVGKLELQGLGHAELLRHLLNNNVRLTLATRYDLNEESIRVILA